MGLAVLYKWSMCKIKANIYKTRNKFVVSVAQ